MFDESDAREVQIIVLRGPETLAALGITEDGIKEALDIAFDEREKLAARWDRSDDESPRLQDMALNIGGVTYKLEDLAEVEVRGWDD
jgi:hypothetical protein